MKAKKNLQIKVPGRGFNMNPSTRVVPHKNKPQDRPKTKELLNGMD